MISLSGSHRPIRLPMELLCCIPLQGDVPVIDLARDFKITANEVLAQLRELRVTLGVTVTNGRVSIAPGCVREMLYQAQRYWSRTWDPNLE